MKQGKLPSALLQPPFCAAAALSFFERSAKGAAALTITYGRSHTPDGVWSLKHPTKSALGMAGVEGGTGAAEGDFRQPELRGAGPSGGAWPGHTFRFSGSGLK